jgi:hypothetical protein
LIDFHKREFHRGPGRCTSVSVARPHQLEPPTSPHKYPPDNIDRQTSGSNHTDLFVLCEDWCATDHCSFKLTVEIEVPEVAMAPSTGASVAAYSKDEEVFCFHHELLYDAKVLELRRTDEKDKTSPFKYRVHYKGWKNT